MRGQGHLFFGFKEGFSISEAFAAARQYFLNKNYLITSIDSSTDLKTLHKWINYLNKQNFKYSFIGQSVFICDDTNARLFDEGLTFYHFDEVYLMPPDVTPIEIPLSIFTSDRAEFRSVLSRTLVEQIKKLRADSYFSDGCGLNFVTRSKSLANILSSIK